MYTNKIMFKLCLAMSLASACSSPSKTSNLAQNAVPSDPNSTVIRVRDNDLIRFVMVSNGRGYELTCKSPLGLLKLVDATGFPSVLLSSYPPKAIDSSEVQSLKLDQQPKLDCDAGTKVLYKSNLNGADKYFFSEKKGSNFLYMFGCQALADAMGFDLTKAKVLDPFLIEDGNFDASDGNDLNCLSGLAIGSKIKWDAGEDSQLFVAPKQKLPTYSFSARNASGGQLSLSFTKEGSCDWIQATQLPFILLVNGDVPLSFREQRCKITITAGQGTISEDKKVLEFKTCPNNSSLSTSGQCYALVNSVTENKQSGLFSGLAIDMADAKNGWYSANAGEGYAIYGTQDGKTWAQQLKSDDYYASIAAVSSSIAWATGSGDRVVRTIDGGKTWTPRPTGRNGFAEFITAVDAQHAWTATYDEDSPHQAIYRTVDGGQTWTQHPMPGSDPRRDFINMKFFDANNGYLLESFYEKPEYVSTLFVTSDGGVSWLPLATLKNSRALKLAALDKNVIVLASANGYVFRSEDGGFTFSQTKVFAEEDGKLNCFSFSDARNGFFTLGNTIYTSPDGGASWRQIFTSPVELGYAGYSDCDFTDPSNGFFLRGDIIVNASVR